MRGAVDLVYYQTFREVAVRQSFTRAAEQLGYAQSSVTTQIQKLEKEFGVQLFERYGRGLRLTSAGEELLKTVTQMLELHQQAKEKLARQGGGSLTIGTIDSLAAYYLPPFVQRIRQSYPELNIRLQPDREDRIVHRVKEGELDFGLMLVGEPTDPALEWTEIREEPLVLVSAPDHPLARLDRVDLRRLGGEEWIMTEETCNYRIMLEKLLRAEGIPYRISLEIGNPEAVKGCVAAGGGIAILPRLAADAELGRGELAALPFSHPDLRLSLQACMHPRKWVSHAMRAFLDSLQPAEAAF
mgnify:CR=1 FL=1